MKALVDEPSTAGLRQVSSVCPRDCPDTCGMVTTVEEGRVTSVRGAVDHPVTRGFLCGRFQHYEELVNHPDRILRPLVRAHKRAPFREVDWDDALEVVAERLDATIASTGPESVLAVRGAGHAGVLSYSFPDRLWNRLGVATVGEEICAAAGQEAMLRHLGDLRGTEPHHLAKTGLYVAWGANPKATSVHAWAS